MVAGCDQRVRSVKTVLPTTGALGCGLGHRQVDVVGGGARAGRGPRGQGGDLHRVHGSPREDGVGDEQHLRTAKAREVVADQDDVARDRLAADGVVADPGDAGVTARAAVVGIGGHVDAGPGAGREAVRAVREAHPGEAVLRGRTGMVAAAAVRRVVREVDALGAAGGTSRGTGDGALAFQADEVVEASVAAPTAVGGVAVQRDAGAAAIGRADGAGEDADAVDAGDVEVAGRVAGAAVVRVRRQDDARAPQPSRRAGSRRSGTCRLADGAWRAGGVAGPAMPGIGGNVHTGPVAFGVAGQALGTSRAGRSPSAQAYRRRRSCRRSAGRRTCR